MGSMRTASHAKYPAAVARGRPLIIACRATAWSASAATAAVAAFTRAGGQVTVLAIVSDGWPEPAAANARFRLLETQAGVAVRVPFVPGLRLAGNPATCPLPRPAAR